MRVKLPRVPLAPDGELITSIGKAAFCRQVITFRVSLNKALQRNRVVSTVRHVSVPDF